MCQRNYAKYVTQLCTVGARLPISKFALMNQVQLQGNILFKNICLYTYIYVYIHVAYIQFPCDSALVNPLWEYRRVHTI